MKEFMKISLKNLVLNKLAIILFAFVMIVGNCFPASIVNVKAATVQTLPNHLIINQVYGAGPNADSSVPVSNSFIELYNPTGSDIDLSTGYTLWYRHGNSYSGIKGTAIPDNNWYSLNLTGKIKAKASYLVSGASAFTTPAAKASDIPSTLHLYFNTGNSAADSVYSAIPSVTADQNWNVRIHNKGVEVLLLDASGKSIYTTANMPANPVNADGKGTKVTGYIDMLGVGGNDSYDASIDGYEGSYSSVQSKQKALRRINFQDTDNNADDFEIVPYNAAYIVNWSKPRSTSDGAWSASPKPVQPDDTSFGTTVPTETPAIYPSAASSADAALTDTKTQLTSLTAAQYNTKATAPYSLTNNFTDDAQSTRTFTWDAPEAVTNGQVQISTANASFTSVIGSKKYKNTIDYSGFKAGILTNINTAVKRTAEKLLDLPLNGAGVNNFSVFRAYITGLQAGTTYYYRVGNDTDGWSPVYTFTTEAKTVADGKDSFTFLNVSDTQATNLGDYQVWQNALDKYINDSTASQYLINPISFILHTGDECDGTNREDEWRSFLGTPTYDAAGTVSGDYRYHFGNNAFFPVVGNHEQSGVSDTGNALDFTQHFTVPDNGPIADNVTKGTVYSYDYGNAHFVVLNTQTDLAAQKEWLEKDLAATTKKWKIVALHRGLYESPGIDNTLVSTFGSVMDKYGVDLIFQGHDHVYMKSKAMRNGKADQNGIGTISVENGSSGAKQDSATNVLDYQEINQTNGAPAFSAVTVASDSITVDTRLVATDANKVTTVNKVNSFSITEPEAQKLADIVVSKIAALPANITLDCSDSVKAARAAYDALSEAEKAMVTNYNTLIAAETTIASINSSSASGTTTGTNSVPATVDNKSTSAVIASINSAIKNNTQIPVIDVTSTPVISKDVFNAIKGQDKTITFSGNNITWTFNGKDITSNVTADIDLSLKAVSAELKNKEIAKLKSVTGKELAIVPFSFNYEGQLPGTATVKVFIGKDWANKIIDVCRYYSDKNTYEIVQGNVKVDSNGYVTYTTNHCSDYFAVEVNSSINLPQTGSIIDFKLLILAGSTAVILGMVLVYCNKKRII